ncbi:guanylate-binding protein 1-like isoform X2 [Mercenaria mercenaria]|nr:guanylate-binding protein 1-like isoform X2 [Mercenaria mercenaria]
MVSAKPKGVGLLKKLFKIPFKSSDVESESAASASVSKRYRGLQIFDKPMHLIAANIEGMFEVNEEALTQIKKIDSPLVVVSIAGLYRTGKSYLMNRLAGSNTGFQLGNTIQSETKGIWVWCRPHPKHKGHVLLLLDTEGLGDVSKGDVGHDNKIFTLASLLCNILVYNMMSAFNQDAVEKLTFITEMSKNISFKSRSKLDQRDGEELALILPTFVLCLRDFTLLLEKDGVQISADQYLEQCLEEKPGKASTEDKYNRPRECIRKYFPRRKCFTFDRPGSRDVIQRLDKTSVKELSKSFLEESELFVQYVYECKGKALLTSKTVNGIMFASLVESYVHAIRNGEVPDVDDAITVVSKLENKRMADVAVETFTRHLKSIQLPVLHTEKFHQLYQNIQNLSLSEYRLNAMFDSESFEKEAIKQMDELWNSVSKENTELVRSHCSFLLKQIFENLVGKKQKSGKYHVPGGYTKYKMDLEAMKSEYNHKTKDIELYEAQSVLHFFLAEETANEKHILFEDQKLTDVDRKHELEKMQAENQQAQKKRQTLYENILKDERESHQTQLAKLALERQENSKQEAEKMNILMDKWKDQMKISEKQIQLMTTENEQQKKQFEIEINKLKEQNLIRENENEERFKKLLENEQKQYKMHLDDMMNAMKDLAEIERQVSEKYEKRFKMLRKNMQKKQEELNNLHEKELTSMKDELEALKTVGKEENKAKERFERERDAAKREKERFKQEKDEERRKREMLEKALNEERNK